MAGKTVDFEARTWCTAIHANNYTTNISASNNIITAGLHLPNSEHGEYWAIDLHDEGTVTIRTQLKRGNEFLNYSLSDTKYINLPVEESTYYIQNKGLKNVMQIDDNASSYSNAGEKMEIQNFDGNNYQKWEFIHQSDGYYRIRSVESDYSLSVRSQYVNSDEKYLCQESFSRADRQLWKFTEYSDRSYVIRPKSGEAFDTDWCMSVGDGIGINGRNVEQREYVNHSDHLNSWFIHKCVGVEEAFLLGISEDSILHDHWSVYLEIMPNIYSMGYDDATIRKVDHMNKSAYLTYIQQCDLYISRSHGASNSYGYGISLSNTSTEKVLPNDIYDYENNRIITPLNCDIMIFSACESANTERNIADAAHKAGARCTNWL